MSSIYRSDATSKVYAGVVVDIAEDSLDRATKLLSGVRGGACKAVGNALSRAAAAGKTAVKRPVTKEYAITQSEFLRQTKSINHFQKSGDDVSVVFGYRGNVIPLLKFHTTVQGDQVVTQVKRNGARIALDNAFKAMMGNHTGVYERIGPDRFPVRELYGPSTPQMIYSNEEVMDAAEEAVAKTYEKRIEHEILRVLNGWGG